MFEDDEARAWRYLLNNRQASIGDIATNCNVTEAFAQGCIDRISSSNWREEHISNVLTSEQFVKDDDDKPRIDLLPPEMLLGTAEVMAYGAKKYSANNWAHGADWSRYYSAMMRHMLAFWSGEDNDDESGLSHLHHASCCLSFLVAYQARDIGNDDRLKPKETPDASMARKERSSSEAA